MNELDQIESLLLQLRCEMLDLQNPIPADYFKGAYVSRDDVFAIIDKHLSDVRKEKEYLAFIRDNEEFFREFYEGLKDK